MNEFVVSEPFMNTMNNSIIKDQENLYFVNPCGLDRDFLSNINASLGEKFNAEFIKKSIKFARSVIHSLNSNIEEDDKIIKKYQWLVEILLWNVAHKQIFQSNNIFEQVKFKNQ